jgi:hypothetical protein
MWVVRKKLRKSANLRTYKVCGPSTSAAICKFAICETNIFAMCRFVIGGTNCFCRLKTLANFANLWICGLKKHLCAHL